MRAGHKEVYPLPRFKSSEYNGFGAFESFRDGADNRRLAFWRGPGGALLCSQHVGGLTQTLPDDAAQYYGGRWMVAETVAREAAEIIAGALGGELVPAPRGES